MRLDGHPVAIFLVIFKAVFHLVFGVDPAAPEQLGQKSQAQLPAQFAIGFFFGSAIGFSLHSMKMGQFNSHW